MLPIIFTAIISIASGVVVASIVALTLINKRSVIISALQKSEENLNAIIATQLENEKQYRNDYIELQRENTNLESEKATLNERVKNAQDEILKENNNATESFNVYKKELEKYQEKTNEELKSQFKNIASSLLQDNNKSFGEASQKDLNNILAPLKDKIKVFQDKVEQTYTETVKEQHSLKNEIKNLFEATSKTQSSAENLANALKGNNKTLGNYGEIILANVLENSGLQEGIGYTLQKSIGAGNIPDAKVILPNNKHIIVDAKTTLKTYEEYISSNDDKMRSTILTAFITSITNHIKSLSNKEYQHKNTNTPNFVLMFIPIEGAYNLALNPKHDLCNFAFKHNIFIVSPTSLMATLRTIHHAWNNERQSKNAVEIAEKAGKMYDKFVGFVGALESVGKDIKSADTHYGNAVKLLSTGDGNLCRKTEELKKMGAKATKSLPKALVEEELPIKEIEPVSLSEESGIAEDSETGQIN